MIDQCSPDLTVAGDKNRILQICTNLVTNAVRASEAGDRITIRCQAREELVEFQVEDTGIGIPNDKLEQIFAPFIQLDRSLSQPREGVGLGLAISRDLAFGMGGTLSVESKVGVGSVFTLALPRAEE